MKKSITRIIITVFLTAAVINSVIAQTIEQPIRAGIINRLSLFSELPVFDYNKAAYNYDAILAVIRTVENREQSGNEGYESLTYKCYAEARFFDSERKNYLTADSVVINGLKLTAMKYGNSNYYFTPEKYIHNVPALSPDIKWKIYGGNSIPTYSGDALSSTLKFPDIYYISNYSETGIIDGQQDWSMTVSKWQQGAGFSLIKPDFLRGWILTLANSPSSHYANFSALIKKDDVTELQYSGTVESRYNIFDSRAVLPGEACAVVRTYKLYPVKVTDTESGKSYDWLFVMGVETEVPVTMR